MRTALVLAGALAALALAGCGGDDEDEAETPGPAAAVPADSVLYAELVLRPDGEQLEALEESLGTLLGTDDPGAEIVDRLNSEAQEGPGLVYQTDVEPWLGERGAVFVTATGKELGAEVATLFDVTDPDAAEAAIETLAEADEADGDPVTDESYDGTSYKLDEAGTAFGLVGDHLVLGNEASLQDVVDVAAGAESLADAEDYSSTLGDADDPAGAFFLDVPALVEAAEAAGELTGGQRGAVESALGEADEQPLTALLEAESDGFAVELAYGATDLPLVAGGETPLIDELPADSWLAAGVPDAGTAIIDLLARAEDFGVASEDIEALGEEFRRAYGLELEEFYEPLGDGVAFANGEGIFGVGGGAVFETEDAESAARLISGLRRAAGAAGEDVKPLAGEGAEGFSIPAGNTPGTINFVAQDDRLLVVYGDASTRAVLEPEDTLADSEEFAAADSALGDEHELTGYLDFAPLAGLLELASVTNPELAIVLPYIESLDFVVAGASSDGERIETKVFLGVADPDVEPEA